MIPELAIFHTPAKCSSILQEGSIYTGNWKYSAGEWVLFQQEKAEVAAESTIYYSSLILGTSGLKG